MGNKGQRLIYTSRELVGELFKSRPAVETDLPEDAKLLELWHHDGGWGYVLRYESESWEPLDEGEEIPKFVIGVKEQNPIDERAWWEGNIIECLSNGLSPAELLDHISTSEIGFGQSEWATYRNVSRQSVSQNIKKAKNKLN
jgi:hypothetical protein